MALERRRSTATIAQIFLEATPVGLDRISQPSHWRAPGARLRLADRRDAGALLVTKSLDERSRASLAATLQAAHAKEALATEMRAVSLSQSAAMRNIALYLDVKAIQDNEAQARELGKRFDVLSAELEKKGSAQQKRPGR
jgi:hypothetical protein